MKIDSTGNIQLTKDNEVFVFGSNDAGKHYGGAARFAMDNYGAELGKGYGLYGQSFAIPTKNGNFETLPLHVIQVYVRSFIQFAKDHKDLTFIVTPIGCGLAGLTPEQVAPMFHGHSSNVVLPKEF